MVLCSFIRDFRSRLFGCLSLVVLSMGTSWVVAQELPEAMRTAMQQINEKRVISTISFLASDELQGRDTPSPGLDIASAYVASRFQGAGLEGLGDDGSYYQVTEIATSQVPTSAQVSINGQPAQVLGVLSAAAEPFSFDGKITLVTSETPTEAEFDGPVMIEAPAFEQPRDPRSFRQKMGRLRQNGATAILVQTTPGHPLIGQSASAAQPRLVNVRGGLTGPVILIASDAKAETASIRLDKQQFGSAKVKNVIGLLPGSDPELSKEAIVFTAHLDHIGVVAGSVGDTINNGADDDATGVTAVLTLADAYAAMPTHPKRSVIFMTFWGEEKGLLGSRYYAKHPAWPLDKTVANINIEMIGRPEPGANEKTWVTGWDESDLGPLMKTGAGQVGILVFEHPKFSAMLYRASDNYSLVEQGVIAHSFSAGSLHDDYHQPTDEWQKLETRHMTRVIEGLFAGSLPIANGELTPQKATK